MRYFRVFALFALLLSRAAPGSLPTGWKVLKDPKGACQITIPEAWDSSSDQAGWAVLRDTTTAIAVVTSQPGQVFKPLPESLLKMMAIPKERIFENSAKRVYYQDKIAANSSDTNAFSVMVPGKAGTCSSRVVFLPEVSEETARKIALSVGPVHGLPQERCADRQVGYRCPRFPCGPAPSPWRSLPARRAAGPKAQWSSTKPTRFRRFPGMKERCQSTRS